MSTMSLPIVSTCSVDGCGYNHDHDCHAGAITVTGTSAMCGTFLATDAAGDKGGTEGAEARVGACHRTDCTHNDHLECTAEGVEVGAGSDTADCLTYSPA